MVNLALAHFHTLGQLFGGGRTAFHFQKEVARFAEAGDHFDHVGGDVHRLVGVDQATLDGLLDPPRSIGTEACILIRIKPLDGANQAEVALVDQVVERHAALGVFLGNVDDEPQVGLDHGLAGGRGIALRLFALVQTNLTPGKALGS